MTTTTNSPLISVPVENDKKIADALFDSWDGDYTFTKDDFDDVVELADLVYEENDLLFYAFLQSTIHEGVFSCSSYENNCVANIRRAIEKEMDRLNGLKDALLKVSQEIFPEQRGELV